MNNFTYRKQRKAVLPLSTNNAQYITGKPLRLLFVMALLMVMTASGLFAQRRDVAPVVPSGGVVYSLPRTGVRVHLKTTRQQFFNGPYHQYAEAFLGLKNAISSDYEVWTIDDIRIETFHEPDPGQVYMAKGHAASLICLTPSGTISGINCQTEKDETAVPVSVFLSAPAPAPLTFTDLSLSPFYENPDSLSNVVIMKSMETKAREAAATIMKLRQRRFENLTNEFNEQFPDGKAYEVVVSELGQLEKNYVSLFIGKTESSTYEYSFDFIPGSASVSGEVLFRFSDAKGVLSKTDMSGKPVVIDLKKLDDLASAQSKLSATVTGVDGLFYRIPGMAEVKIMNGLNLIASARVSVAQFGSIAPVPDDLLGGSHQVSFHPSTGAIMSIVKE